MPTIVTKETAVYTLEELEALSWSVHEKAKTKVLEWIWEGFEPSLVTEDMEQWILREYPLFNLHHGKRRQDQSLFWDMDRLTCEARGDIDIREYMKAEKLCNKFRALWYAVDKLGCNETIGVSFGQGKNVDLWDLQHQIDYDDDIYDNKPRYGLICKQIEALQTDIQNYVDGVQSAVVKYMRSEADYRSSDEAIKEEIESYEMVFTEEGNIYRG